MDDMGMEDGPAPTWPEALKLEGGGITMSPDGGDVELDTKRFDANDDGDDA